MSDLHPGPPPGPDAPTTSLDEREDLAPLYSSTIRTLRAGFVIGGSLLVIGILISLYRREDLLTFVHPMDEVMGNLVDGESHAFIDLAFIVIMVTPVITVLRVAVGFSRFNDRRFAIYSVVVLGILAASIGLSLVR
jgi:uncharacterized membrane protein